MKSDIKPDIMRGENGWSYTITCVRCRAQERHFDTNKPKTQEPDFCTECLCYFHSKGVPLRVLRQQYSALKAEGKAD